ncbi:unnamed protein product [Orchesella dallaii]|uniref:Uncharacterized protein n=1 Tax=Orchesella dallaii TaxID=48710 RepID=A0ABP1PYB1_9HEXA
MSRLYIICSIFVLFVASRGAILSWNIFGNDKHLNSTSFLREFANQRLSSLRSLRDKLSNSSVDPQLSKVGSEAPQLQLFTAIKSTRSDEAIGNIFKKFGGFLAFAKPLKKMISSKDGIEALASMVIPKRDILHKLLEIKGNLEPGLKRYLTDKYNWFLTSLIPYSENIGVPPFVLNSMKVPQDFDPRWQFIKTLLESQGGMDKFIHSVVSGNALGNLPEVIESRSGDETELISDQEPDASNKGYRKHQQQLYLSSFKKRLSRPSNKFKINAGVRPPSHDEYETSMDQQGQYGHTAYDVRSPEDLYAEAYYNNAGVAGDPDMTMSASGHGGRGHGGGGGYGGGHGGGQASYGGFLDPFTILGGLAFLTYLGLMLQNSLNRNMTGRSLPWETRMPMPVIPITLKAVQVENARYPGQVRRERSLSKENTKDTFSSRKVDEIVQDIRTVWKEIQHLRTQPIRENRSCVKFNICKVVSKLKEISLEDLFSSILFTIPDEEPFVKNLLEDRTPPSKMCHQWSQRCVDEIRS